MLKLNIDCKATTINLIGHNCYCIKAGLPLRESFPRQVDKSRGPQGESGLEFSRRRKGQTSFSPLHSLGPCILPEDSLWIKPSG